MDRPLTNELLSLAGSNGRALDFILRNSADGFFFWELNRPEKGWMNKDILKILGFSTAGVFWTKNKWKKIVNQTDLILARKNIRDHLENPDISVNHKLRFYSKKGSVVWIQFKGITLADKNGTSSKSLGLYTDITENEQNKLHLQEENYSLKNLVGYTSAGIAKLSADGKFLAVNKSLALMTGYSESDLMNYRFEEIISSDINNRASDIFSETMKVHPQQFISEFRSAKKNKEEWLRIYSNAILDARGQIEYFVFTLMDISNEKKTKDDLICNIDRYRKAQQLGKTGNWEYNLRTMEFWGSEQSKCIYGYPADKDFFSTEDVEGCIPERERVHQALIDLIEKNKPYNLEFEIISADTQERKIINSIARLERDSQGNPLKVTGTIVDITERKKIENILKQSQGKYKTLFEESKDIIFISDYDGQILDVNKRASELLGYAFNEFIGKNILDYYSPEEAQILKNHEKHYFSGKEKSETFESLLLTKDGGVLDVEVILKTLSDSSGWTQWIIRDITEQKKHERDLIESEERFRKVSGFSADYSYSHRIHENGEVSLEWSFGAFEEISGYSPEEMSRPEQFAKLIHPDDWMEGGLRVEKLLKGETVIVEMRIITKEGKIKWIRDKGVPEWDDAKRRVVRIIGTASEITQQKEALLALQNSENKFRGTFNYANFGIILADIQGQILDVNDQIIKLQGYPKDEFLTLQNSDFTHPDDLKRESPLLSKLIKGQIDNYRLEKRIYSKSRKIIWVDVSVASRKNEYGEVDMLIAMILDINEKKETENYLRESEERLSLAIEGAGLGTWDWDLKTGKIITNRNWLSMKGYREEEVTPDITWWREQVHPEDKPVVEKILDDHLQGITARYESEFRVRNKEGQWIWIIDKGMIIERDEKGNPLRICGIHIDVTERKITEKRIIEQKEEYEALNEELRQTNEELQQAKNEVEIKAEQLNSYIENAPDGVFIADEKGNYLEVNKAAIEVTGYSRNELLKKSIPDLIIEEDLKKARKHFSSVKKNGFAKDVLGFVTKSGEKRHWSVEAVKLKETRFLGFVKDITLQLSAEEHVKESKIKLEKILQIAPVAIGQTKNRKIKEVNDKCLDILGYERHELMGKDTRLLYPTNQEYDFVGKNIFENMPAGSPGRVETKWKRKDGKIIHVILSTITLSNRSRGSATIFSALNISDRIKYELQLKESNEEYESLNEELRQANEELIHAKEKAERANQLKNEFIHNLSHEIRTPMNGIMGFSRILSNPELTGEKKKYYASIIQNSSRQLLRIIDDILEISALQTKQLKILEESFYLNDFLMELFAVFNLKSKQCKISIYIKKGLQDKESLIKTDKTKLGKILNNLMENAIKYTSRGFIEIGYFCDEQFLKIYVKDTGKGIAKENQVKIFDRFSRESDEETNHQGALGLGLSISKENAILLGGDIYLESEKGKGSCFYVNLPLSVLQSINVEKNYCVQNPENYGDSINILVAEDDDVNYLYFEAILNEINGRKVRLFHARNGEEAVKICRGENLIHIILMDIKMPVMNGYEAAEIIQKEFPDIKLVAQTAYSSSADRDFALHKGFVGYIAKPVNENDLINLLSRYVK